MNRNTSEEIKNYSVLKSRLESMYEHIAKGIKIRSRCQLHGGDEKSTNFFLYLEKQSLQKVL